MFDDCVGEILAAVRAHGLDRRTIVLVTGDHGDDLYEPGATLGHGLGFIGGDQANHVPFVLHVPGAQPRRFTQLVRTLDMAPTLAGLAGVARPADWEGRDLAGWLDGRQQPASLPFFAETGFPFIRFRVPGIERPALPPMDELTFIDRSFNHQFVLRPEYEQPLVNAKERCLRTERWKLVCTPTAAGSRHFRLFYLLDDPHCLHDVKDRHPEAFAALRRALEAWIDEGRETLIEEIFPRGEPAGGDCAGGVHDATSSR
jgi:arylsulfatase A-like enzyme